jgi:hypothetical protein
MLTYRAYQVDEAGHVLGPPEVIYCNDDDTAIDRAKPLANRRDVELWQLDRLVIRLPRDRWRSPDVTKLPTSELRPPD